MRLANSNAVLSERLTTLLDNASEARIKLAKRMRVADGTLGRIKYGQGNATLEVLDRIAAFFRLEPWELIKPASDVREATLDDLAALATPRSRAAIEAIRQAAEEGRLTDADLVLLQHIAERFMTSTPARPGAIHAALERKLNRDADAES